MIVVVYALGYIVMFGLPLLIGAWLSRTRGAAWRLFLIGMVTFVLAQAVHIPFNWLIGQSGLLPMDLEALPNLLIVATFLGLSAGVFEEVARYLAYRFWARDARSWGTGLMLGAGHGGVEAMLLALIGAINVGILFAMRSGFLIDLVPPEQLGLLQAQIAAVFDAPWYAALLPAIERVFAMCAQLALSLLVLQVFLRRNILWLFAAILWHAVIDALAVVGIEQWGVYVTEAILGVTAVINLALIWYLRQPEPTAPAPEPLPEPPGASSDALDVTADMLDRSRYS